MPSDTTATGLLTRHFLQRLLDNDLISPNADRHEAVAMTCAALVSASLFISVLLSAKYLMAPFVIVGEMALVSLDDKFLLIAASMIVMALVGLAEWDALPLDERDTSILGPLPIVRSAIVRAKLTALVLFAGGFAVVLNGGPSVLYTLFLAARLPVGVTAIATLIATHFLVTIAAGAFGLLTVVGLRELLRACLGFRLFRRISTTVQACLVVLCATAFLLLPVLSSGVARRALAPGAWASNAVPPLWFVGLYETTAGHVMDELPRGRLPPRVAPREREATAAYRAHRGVFRELSSTAISAFGGVMIIGIAGYAWNNRRLPVAPPARARARRPTRRLLAALARRIVVRHHVAQAGYCFALQTLFRSAPHRLAMATALAVGLALVMVSLRGIDVRLTFPPQAGDAPAGPVTLWVVQTMLVGMLLLGFRHAVRIPASVPAGWNFHLAWSGDERPYLAGVKSAGLIAVVVPLLALLYPLHVLALGPRLAAAHLLCGLLLARVSIDLLFLGLRQPPFACSYVPASSLKMVAPILIVAFYLLAYAFAALERFALDRDRPVAFFTGLLVLLLGVRALDAWQRRERVVVELDEQPMGATQRLDLSG